MAGRVEELAGAPAIAQALAAKTDVEAMATHVTEVIAHTVYPDYMDDAVFAQALDRSVRENVRNIVHLIAGRLVLEDTRPDGALEFADVNAELGVPASGLERGYWVGVATFWRHWFDLAMAEDPDALPELLPEPTRLLFAYIDRVLEYVLSRYDETRADMVRTREHLRRAVLTQLLAGDHGEDLHEVEIALGYPLRHHHLAFAWQGRERRRAEEVLEGAATAGNATATLLLQHGAGEWVGWLGFPSRPKPPRVAAVHRALEAGGEPVTCGGDPSPGVAGLRTGHEQAVRTARVQRALGGTGLLRYEDVRLEALLLADEDSARRYVAEELGPLAGPDARLARIRETLLAWFGTGTQAGAAATLGLHENTVRQRIRAAEDLLPGALTRRRAELQVALRLERVVGSDTPDP